MLKISRKKAKEGVHVGGESAELYRIKSFESFYPIWAAVLGFGAVLPLGAAANKSALTPTLPRAQGE